MQIKSLNIKNMLVIGDLMVDKYIDCDVNRISPESPIPVLEYKNTRTVLGGAANVASNLVANAQNVEAMGSVGDDANGAILRKLLKNNGIGQEYVFTTTEKITTAKSRFVSKGYQMFRFDEESVEEIDNELEMQCLAKIEAGIKEFDIIIISDYLKGFLPEKLTQGIIALANKNNIPVVVDPKDKNELKYRHCTLIKPNKKEMEAFLGGKHIDDTNVADEARALKKKIDCKYVLLTLGAKGMLFIDENDKDYYIESEAKEVYDVTGAGDTVLSFVAMGFEGTHLKFEQIEIANRAAAVKVSKFGTSVVKYGELFSDNSQGKEANIKEIAKIAEKRKRAGEKIVFTNGCFDILHGGHVKYLHDAKELGDILVVGLNSDASVKMLKGESRPIVCEQERAEVLAGLSSIDYVVLFDEETPIELIKAIKPNVLVKGGDYVVNDIVGYDEVTGNGGQVLTIPFVEGKSTTNIVEKIMKL